VIGGGISTSARYPWACPSNGGICRE
jgi:hypothetical protein